MKLQMLLICTVLLIAGCAQERTNENTVTVCQGQLVSVHTYANGIFAIELQPSGSPAKMYGVALSKGSSMPTQADVNKWYVLKCATWGENPKHVEWTLVPWTQ